MAQDVLGERLRVGVNPQDTLDDGARFTAESAARGRVQFAQYTGDALGTNLSLWKARGTVVAPANVVKDDSLGGLYFQAYSNGFVGGASFASYVDAAVVAGQRPASRLEFATNLNNAAPRLVGYVSSEGYLGWGLAFAPSAAATRAAYPVHIVGSGQGETYLTVESYDASANNTNPTLRLGRARGTFAAPATVNASDIAGEVEFFAYNNGVWYEGSEVQGMVAAAPVAGQTPSMHLILKVSSNTFGGQVSRQTLFAEGNIGFGEAGALTSAQLATAAPGVFYFGESFNPSCMTFQYAGANTSGYGIILRKSRGASLNTPATVQNGDEIFNFRASAYTNAWHTGLAGIRAVVSAAVVAGQNPQTDLQIISNTNNATGTAILTAFGSGIVAMSDAAAVTEAQRATINPFGTVWIARAASPDILTLHSADAGGNGTKMYFRRSKGASLTVPTALASGDRVMGLFSEPYNGTGYSGLKSIMTFVDAAVVAGQSPAMRIEFAVNANNTAEFTTLRLNSDGSIRIGNPAFNLAGLVVQNANMPNWAFFSNAGSFGSGQGVIFIGNRDTAPSANPVAGGILYAEAGALKYRGSGGTTTTIANA